MLSSTLMKKKKRLKFWGNLKPGKSDIWPAYKAAFLLGSPQKKMQTASETHFQTNSSCQGEEDWKCYFVCFSEVNE